MHTAPFGADTMVKRKNSHGTRNSTQDTDPGGFSTQQGEPSVALSHVKDSEANVSFSHSCIQQSNHRTAVVLSDENKQRPATKATHFRTRRCST
jgi:hypothetical protein